MERLPNTIVLTFPKTGSTSLYYTFSQHPEICLPNSKETWFFEQFQNMGIQWYEDKYMHCAHRKIRCDFVSTLMYNQGFSRLLKEIVPHAKFVVLLRDPIKRSISHHFHEIRKLDEKESFERALQLEQERIKKMPSKYSHMAYKDIGRLYKTSCEELLESFGRDQLYFVLLEELTSSSKYLSDLWGFLDVQAVNATFGNKNVARLPRNTIMRSTLNIPEKCFNYLQENVVLKNFIPPFVKHRSRNVRGKVSMALSSISEIAYKKASKQEIPQNLYNELVLYYNDTLSGLDLIINKNLSAYWPWYKSSRI